MKKMIIAGLIALSPTVVMAANIGNCGWGSKVFDGQSGVMPQVFAATTNGSTGNQTFGISSGTSGCTQDGTVTSSWKTAMFIDGNKKQLARDMSQGQGETLDALASLIGIDDAQKPRFFQLTQEKFPVIYYSEDASATDISNALKAVMSSDSGLAVYAANI
jgi:Protein of unknown function (DUF3015)